MNGENILIWMVDVNPHRVRTEREEIDEWFIENKIPIQRWYSENGGRTYIIDDETKAILFKLRFG